jgi:hypothetical protein
VSPPPRCGTRWALADPWWTERAPSLPPPNVFVAVTDTEKLKNRTETPTVSVAVPVTDETPPRSS